MTLERRLAKLEAVQGDVANPDADAAVARTVAMLDSRDPEQVNAVRALIEMERGTPSSAVGKSELLGGEAQSIDGAGDDGTP